MSKYNPIVAKAWREKNKEKIKEQRLQYMDKILQGQKNYRLKNLAKDKRNKKAYYQKTKERDREKRRLNAINRREAHAAETRRDRLRYPKKVAARMILNGALKKQEIHKKPCSICQNPKSEGHHDDYNKPLNVRWLCSLHHKAWHQVFIPINGE